MLWLDAIELLFYTRSAHLHSSVEKLLGTKLMLILEVIPILPCLFSETKKSLSYMLSFLYMGCSLHINYGIQLYPCI